MRRLSGLVLAGALVLLPASMSGNGFAEAAPGQAAAPPQKTTFTGDAVIQAFSVNPDKVADYEKVIAQLKDALQKSAKPEAKQQAAGWKVFKNAAPNPDGSIVYVHVINPVVKDADYSILNNIYDVVTDPMEKLNVYNTYRGALKQALFVIQGQMTADLGK